MNWWMLKLDIWASLSVHGCNPPSFPFLFCSFTFFFALLVILLRGCIFQRHCEGFIVRTICDYAFCSAFFYPRFLVISIMLRFQLVVDGWCDARFFVVVCCYYSLLLCDTNTLWCMSFLCVCARLARNVCVKNDVWWELGVFSGSCYS